MGDKHRAGVSRGENELTYARKLVWALTILTAVGLLGVYSISWFIALLSPLALEYEGPALWAAMELAKGHNIYDPQSLSQAPWAVTIYTPIFFALGAPFQMNGYNFASLRLISMLSDVAALFFFYKLLGLYTRDRLRISIGLLLLGSYVSIWSGSLKARVDMLALALSIAAMYFVVRAVETSLPRGRSAHGDSSIYFNATISSVDLKAFDTNNPDALNFRLALDEERDSQALSGVHASPDKKKSGSSSALMQTALKLLPGIVVSVAAVYAKLSSVVILPAVCIYLLFKKRYSELGIYFSSTIALAVFILLILDSVTGGGFLQHITFAFNVPFSSEELNKHLHLLGVDWPKVVMVPTLALLWWMNGKGRGRLVLPFSLALISGVLTVYTIGTVHANLNHGMLFYCALSWLTVVFIEAYPLSLGTTMILASALCTYILGTQVPNMYNVSNRMGKSVEDLKHLKVAGETIFVEDPTLAIVCGAKPLFVDVATFLQVWDRDKRSLTDIERSLESKQFPVVIINLNDSLNNKPTYYWSDAVLKSINDGYKKVDYVIGNGDLQQIYEPDDSKAVK